ncbi:MAG: GNAT family N-acetyltransferase [Acidothermaceae bacterium]
MTSLHLRAAGPTDAEQIALLHADSWRKHYRGVYSDSYLDGDLVDDRRAVWHARLNAPAQTFTTRADDDGEFVGFIHVVLDDDPQWGTLVDNLHVTAERKRAGIGRALLASAAEAIAERATHPSMYLWVQEANTPAQAFYRAVGGSCVETAKVGLPGGVPGRLTGTPNKLRFAWPDVAAITSHARSR